jgi:hypothetical protein
MHQQPLRPQPEFIEEPLEESWSDCLTPAQRLDLIAEVMASIALRLAMRNQSDQ